jgi:prepilin-type N-terminal cleavage/methylation domain-containing protein
MRSADAKAFTLVEILVVVVVLGILAAMVVPKFSNAAATARASMLADDLRIVRTQIEVFAGQHNVPPGYPNCDPAAAPTEDSFVTYMTKASRITGETAEPGTAGFPYGPYMRVIPPNPVNALATVQVIPDDGSIPAAADGSHGWIYQPATLTFKADCMGQDESGAAYFDY